MGKTENKIQKSRFFKAKSDFELLEIGKEYNRSLNLYENVNRNERFYRGDQWDGINSGGLPTPVFNIFKRIINYCISNIMQSSVAMKYTFDSPYGETANISKEEVDAALKKLNDIALHRRKKMNFDGLLTDALYDAAVTGDAIAYTFWDPTVKTGQNFTGDFCTVLLDNTNVFFGNPNSKNINAQPYILISSRELVGDVIHYAAAHGLQKEDLALILPDDDRFDFAGDFAKKEIPNTKCITLTKLWRGENGHIFFRKSVKDTVICDDTDTKLNNYPICFFNWTPVKNSWHGQAPGTGLCENQVFINKAFAMVMKHMMDTSFSKVIYDSTVIDEWSNRVGEAVAVNGPVENAAYVVSPGQMQTGMLDVINMAIAHTKEFMGATDTALGEVSPTNTSAILALQQSSNQPLETVRHSLYSFVSSIGKIWLDFILTCYDDDRLTCINENGENKFEKFDFSKFRRLLFDCEADVGAGSYWSEISSLNTLDNLLISGHIDTVQYLERIPDGLVPGKAELIKEIRERKENITDERTDKSAGI